MTPMQFLQLARGPSEGFPATGLRLLASGRFANILLVVATLATILTVINHFDGEGISVTALSMAGVVGILLISWRARNSYVVFTPEKMFVQWFVSAAEFQYEQLRGIHWHIVRGKGAAFVGVALEFPPGRFYLPFAEEAANAVACCFAICNERGIDTSSWLLESELPGPDGRVPSKW